jgi:hypothetical protein
MKIFLLMPYILGLVTSKFIGDYNQTMVNPAYNKTIQNITSNNQTIVAVNNDNKTSESFIANSKQCYQCSFIIDDSIGIKKLFNEHCSNKARNCDNTFCSIMLSRNQYGGKYILELGCVSENYCLEFNRENTEQSEAVNCNYSDCCNSNLCNDEKAVQRLLPKQSSLVEPVFIINPGNTYYAINDTVPVNQAVISEAVVSNILHDFNFADNNQLNKYCLHEAMFTNKDNLIITLKQNRCNNKKITQADIPFSISQPINKIILLDKNNKTIHELLSSTKGITSFNYIANKNLLFFISNNYVFIYKLDDNKQLTQINKIYFKDDPVDVTINHNSNILAIANKDKVFFYDISQIEQNEEPIPKNVAINSFNIYNVQYAPNNDVLLVEAKDSNNLHTSLYNVENLNETDLIGIAPLQKIQEKPKQMSCTVNYFNSISGVYRWINAINYYGKWIIAPSGDFMMKHKIIFACPPPRTGILPREERYSFFNWDKKIIKHKNSSNYNFNYDDKTTNLEMFSNRYRYATLGKFYSNPALGLESIESYLGKLTDIVAVYSYFFAKKPKTVLALIAEERKKATNNRYLYLKNIFANIRGDSYITGIDKQNEITRKRLFNLAHTGIFNNDNSKLAIFSDNRIQIHSINLPNNTQTEIITSKIPKEEATTISEIKTTVTPEEDTTETQNIKTTVTPEEDTTETQNIKTTRFDLFPSYKKNISLLNIHKKSDNFQNKIYPFIKEYSYAFIIGGGLLTFIAMTFCVVKYKKIKKKFKQKNIEKKVFLNMGFNDIINDQNEDKHDIQELNVQEKQQLDFTNLCIRQTDIGTKH